MQNDEIFERETLYKSMNEYKDAREGRIALASAGILVFLGLTLGVVLFRIVSDNITSDNDYILGDYFNGIFLESEGLGAKLKIIIDSYFHELLFPFVTFVFGYTVFAPLFSAALCIWQSALCGFSVCMLDFSKLSGMFTESLIYLACRVLIIVICISVSLRAFLYSRKFVSEKSSLADIFKRSDSKEYAIDFLISGAALFIVLTLTLVLLSL